MKFWVAAKIMLLKVLTVFLLMQGTESMPINTEVTDLLDSTLNAVDSTLSFYAKNYKNVNLDGIFGLRILQGQLVIISADQSSVKLNSTIRKRLKTMEQEAKRIADGSLQSIQEYQPEYYKVMGQAVKLPFTYAKPFRHINLSLAKKKSIDKRNQPDSLYRRNKFSMSEEASDKCIEELFGKEEGSACSRITDQCVLLMTRRGQIDYDITHQLIYIMFAYLNDCTRLINEKLARLNVGNDLGQIQEEMCADNFLETSEAVRLRNGEILPRLQDLFLEQQFVCPMAGYGLFLHSHWLRQILSWQRANGCWGLMPRSTRIAALPEDDYEYSDTVTKKDENSNDISEMSDKLKSRKNMADKKIQAEEEDVRVKDDAVLNVSERRKKKDEQQPSHYIGRKLLYDRKLSDGCLSHKTAVALGAISQYIRVLVLSTEIVDISGINFLMRPDELRSKLNNHKNTSDISNGLNLNKNSNNVAEFSKSTTRTDNKVDTKQVIKDIKPNHVKRKTIEKDYDDVKNPDQNDGTQMEDNEDNGGEVEEEGEGAAGGQGEGDRDMNNDYLEEDAEENLDNKSYEETDIKTEKQDLKNKKQEENEEQDEEYTDEKDKEEAYEENDENLKEEPAKKIGLGRDGPNAQVMVVETGHKSYNDINLLRGRARPGLDLLPERRFAEIPMMSNQSTSNPYSSISILYVLVTALMIVVIISLYKFTQKRRALSMFYHRRIK